MYASVFLKEGSDDVLFDDGAVDVVSSLFTGAGSGHHPVLRSNCIYDLEDVVFSDMWSVRFDTPPNSASDLKFVHCNYGALFYTASFIADVAFVDNSNDVSL